MTLLHDPSNPRHARLFELMRQTDQATQTKLRLALPAARPLDEELANKFMSRAVQSLRSGDLVRSLSRK